MTEFDEIQTTLSCFIVFLSIIIFTSVSSSIAESIDGVYTSSYTHDRHDEIQNTCAHFLASSTTIDAFTERVHRTKNELSFFYGDWEQKCGGSPIMPFPMHRSSVSSNPMKLASFTVTYINRPIHTAKFVRISATLILEISHNILFNPRFFNSSRSFFSRRSINNTDGFRFFRGRSQLFVSFQGVYTENNGGRTLCMLGETHLPLRQLGSSDVWKSFIGSHPHPVLRDDQIILILRYPGVFSLTSRSIRGEMHSLNPRKSPKYFDRIDISSQLSYAATYEFGSEHILAKACDPYPFKDDFITSEIDIYKGTDFCRVLRHLNSYKNGAFKVLPNWKCTGTDDFCSRLGPFPSDKAINSTNGGFQNVNLLFQDLRCVDSTYNNEKTKSARVSAVFRAVSPLERNPNAARRTGMGNTTISVEGFWKSSSGQLCLVGCSTNTCNSRISLYISSSLSIHHRSTMFGTIHSIDSRIQSHFPLSFQKHTQLSTVMIFFPINYYYSKIDSAGAVLERNEPFSFRSVITKSLLTFPRLGNQDQHMNDVSILAKDLTLHLSGISNSSRFNLMIQIISIGRLFGREWTASGAYDSAKITEKQLLLNVSAEMNLEKEEHSNFSSLSLEGIYDSHLGKMYLIGCRDVRASWSILHESMDLEEGLDCLIEVVVSYPPMNTHGLMNPTARISIASQRNVDDPLNFDPLNLKVYPVLYINQQKDVLLRTHIEGALRIFTLSIAMCSVLSQLYHITLNRDSAAYISLVMLFVEAAGYTHPLVTSTEAIMKNNYDKGLYYISNNSEWINTFEYTVNILLLLTLITTLRISQKVWKSRTRLQVREGGSSTQLVPRERFVLVITLIIHMIGYGAVLGFQFVSRLMFGNPTRNSGLFWGWKMELGRYMGLVKDMFLLPQIAGNIVWNVGCKPLRPTFFVGITFVRILPHVYDFIVVLQSFDDQYFIENGKFVDYGFDFYSKFDDVLIPIVAMLLAVVVHLQQKCGFQKLVKLLGVGGGRFFRSSSDEYQRVGTSLPESELVSTTIDEAVKEAK